MAWPGLISYRAMIWFLGLLVSFITVRFKSRARLESENIVLRHQIGVLRRQTRRRLVLSGLDRLIFVWLYRIWPEILTAISIIRPETVVRWQRAGFHGYWRWRSRAKWGRPKAPVELRRLIREISLANPLWGAPRIHGELLKLGFEVAQSTVAKYMARGRFPPSQSWKTFLRNHANGIAATDLFVVPTIGMRLLFGLVMVCVERRLVVMTAVTMHPTAEWIARQITEAFPWGSAPQYLIHDRDSSYGPVFRRRLQAMGIRDRPTAPRSPWQNCYAERLIGSIRRECLDHVIILGEEHLRRVLKRYVAYYNRSRTHLALAKDSPIHRPIHREGRITALPILGGLHHCYARR